MRYGSQRVLDTKCTHGFVQSHAVTVELSCIWGRRSACSVRLSYIPGGTSFLVLMHQAHVADWLALDTLSAFTHLRSGGNISVSIVDYGMEVHD